MTKKFTLYGIEKKSFKNSNGNVISYYSAFGVFEGLESNCYLSLKCSDEDFNELANLVKANHYVVIKIDIEMSVYNYKLAFKYNYSGKEK